MNNELMDAIIFIPFTDGEYEMLIDTIESIEYYVKESHHIVAVDDCSAERLDLKLMKSKPSVTVLRNEQKYGGRNGLYITMAKASKYVLKNFSFKVFMKMDTDALMVGKGLVTEAINYFNQNTKAGILGSYKVKADGKKRNWNKWKIAFLYESSFIRPLLGKKILWRSVIREAKKNNYDIGENILGGAYFIRYECLIKMLENGYLDYDYEGVLKHSKIGDEIIYSLFCKACGYDLHDFGKPEHTMALALDTLPLRKEEIIAKRKTVVHSLKKGKDGESQDELRLFFRKIRNNVPANDNKYRI